MVNTSGLHPIGKRVLVLLEEVPTAHGAIALTNQTIERDQMAQIHARIVELGPDLTSPHPPGTRVCIKRYAGEYLMGVDNLRYRILSYDDIHAHRDFDLPQQGA